MTRRIAVAMALGYAALAVVFTFPLIMRLGSGVAGRSTDAEQFLWSYWWFRQALVVRHTTPFWTAMLYYPEGTSLLFFTTNTLHALISIPLQPLIGLVPTYNLLGIATFVISGLAAAWLAYDVSGSRAGAFVAGIAWAFAPIQHFHWRVGQYNMLSVECVPIYVLCLRRVLAAERPPDGRRRWILGAAASLSCAALDDWQFGVYLGLLSIVLVAVALWTQRRAWWPILLRAGLVAGLAIVVLLPYVVPMAAELASPDPYMVRTAADTLDHSADLAAFFVPNPAHPLWGDWATRQLGAITVPGIVMTVVSLSYVTLALAAVGALRQWRRARLWVWIGIVFWVLSLGPQLRLFGRVTAIPLPYQALFQLKVIQISRFPGRYVLITLLCLAQLAALGVGSLASRPARDALGRRARVFGGPAITALVAAALVFELLPAPRFVEPLAPSPAFYADGTLEGAGALYEIPNPSNRGMYFATLHGRPVLYGELSRDNPAGPFLAYLRGGFSQPDVMTSPTNWNCAANYFNITNLALYRKNADTDRSRAWRIEQQLGPQTLVADSPEAALYRVPPDVADKTCIVIGEGWGTPRPFGLDQPLYRWAGQQATLALLRRAPGRVTLRFTGHSFASPRRLQVRQGQQLVGEFAIGVAPQPRALDLDLPAGVTWLELRGVEPALSPADFGYADTAPVTIGFSQLAVEER